MPNMPVAWPKLTGALLPVLLLLKSLQDTTAIAVESIEVLKIEIDAFGEFDGERGDNFVRSGNFVDFDPRDSGCDGRRCTGMFTRDGSLELDSRYSCIQPAVVEGDDPDRSTPGSTTCSLAYWLEDDAPITLAGMKIAFHPDSVTEIQVVLDDVILGEWTGTPGSSELQEIPGVEGSTVSTVTIYGVLEPGDFFGVLEVEFFAEVDEVPAIGVSAATRATISATATTDAGSAMNTLDGDATDASSWTCSSGETCEITYDLGDVESLQQLRIAFSDTTDAGGEFNILTAGVFEVFSPVRSGLEAGGRPLSSDGLATFGGVLALARYVKIEAVPASGGIIAINEVEFRVKEDAPARAVFEKVWLKDTGKIPLGAHATSDESPSYDNRPASSGGCDSPGPLEGCHVLYAKDGDRSADSRWSCGPQGTSDFFTRSPTRRLCGAVFSLNTFRYVGQVRLEFYKANEEHHEVSIETLSKEGRWVTVVPSAITLGDPGKYDTFDIDVHTNAIRITPMFQRYDQWIGIKELVIYERSKKSVIAGTVPVWDFVPFFDEDSALEFEATSRFRFELPAVDDSVTLETAYATITGVRMRFPANRQFTFDVETANNGAERFTSAGERNQWETFTLSRGFDASRIEITSVDGPEFANKPSYPALRVVDFQVLGEVINNAGVFDVASTAIVHWNSVPNMIVDGMSDQEYIMTAICETKGASFDGTDCVGELNDATVEIFLERGEYYVDGPIFVKSGVNLRGGFSDEFPSWSFLNAYDGPNSGNTAEDAVIVMDGITGARVGPFRIRLLDTATGPIVPGTVGNLGLEIKNSEEVEVRVLHFESARTGGARFTDSRNITATWLVSGEYETGNFLDVSRVDNLVFAAIPEIGGLLIEDSNNLRFEGSDESGAPNPVLDIPTGGEQTVNVLITGDSSGVVFKEFSFGEGPEPRMLVESTAPVTLEAVDDYAAVIGDCIVQVPEGSTDDSLIQVGSEQTLVRSGNCWVLA